MVAERLTWEQVRAWRLRRQHLVDRAPRSAMLQVVRAICEAQVGRLGTFLGARADVAYAR